VAASHIIGARTADGGAALIVRAAAICSMLAASTGQPGGIIGIGESVERRAGVSRTIRRVRMFRGWPVPGWRPAVAPSVTTTVGRSEPDGTIVARVRGVQGATS
jgi:hypothetical protein